MKTLLLMTLFLAAAIQPVHAESYVVSPKASAETKAAVSAGKPPEHGFPVIEAIDWKFQSNLRPGASEQATVETSRNVHYVEVRVKYWNQALVETGPGKFHIEYRVPLLPPSALGHWDLEVIARSIDGVEVKKTFPVTYSYF